MPSGFEVPYIIPGISLNKIMKYVGFTVLLRNTTAMLVLLKFISVSSLQQEKVTRS